MEEKFVFFWGNKSPFSNWHSAVFEIHGIRFNCSEQYMMYKKAMLFEDVETAKKIVATTNPAKQKALGRQVKNFEQETWEQHCKQIVYEANYAKFTQNENLLKALFKTKGSTLVEASPVDFIWGIGLAESDPRAKDRSQWRGKNWLGEVLTKLRNDLINQGYEKRVKS
jgi:ribA/ribD-fused uncharacterized protein